MRIISLCGKINSAPWYDNIFIYYYQNCIQCDIFKLTEFDTQIFD